MTNIPGSLRELGNIQVNEWDFMTLVNKDIGDFEISRSLRRLGNLKVTEWDFRTVLPAVNRLAHQEVDLLGIVKRTAHYKVMDWDFRDLLASQREDETGNSQESTALSPTRQELMKAKLQLKAFLEYVSASLIAEPHQAELKVSEIDPGVLRFTLTLVKKDAAMLIGRGGHTAAAIRRLLKARAASYGTHALLEILSHEEDTDEPATQ